MKDTEDALESDTPVSGERVTIIGLAREGVAIAQYLANRGAAVTVSDMKTSHALADSIRALSPFGIKFVLGAHPEDILDCDRLFVSPGVPLNIPILREATRRGIPVSGESRFFLENCPAPVIGITGSSGKTTTVSLTGEMLKATGVRTWVGGNIGEPLTPHLDEIRAQDRVVMELSSFQLEIMRSSPEVAAILNITPNHLDRHLSMEKYTEVKSNILRYQKSDDVAVLGYDNPVARRLANVSRGTVAWFSIKEEVSDGAFLRQGRIVLRLQGNEQVICHERDIQLRGRHNVENVLAACTIARVAGADSRVMSEVVSGFKGVEHRLEHVGEADGVRYYNDSIATSPERAAAALRAFEEPIILLAGGQDKDLPWDDLAALMLERTRGVVLFGQAAGIIEKALSAAIRRSRSTGDDLPIIERRDTLEEAVMTARRLARPGDIVLLSPGGTSYDAFEDFEERGVFFRGLVKGLL